MSNKTILIFTIVAFALGGVFYLLYPTPDEYKAPTDDNDDEEVVCTADAYQCPDGSWVGRTGPKCEFTPCPIPPGTKMEDGTIE